MKNLFFILILFASFLVYAGNPGVSYQGRIIKPDGLTLEGSAVQFRMQIRSPGSENCLLYEELQTLNMLGSSGVFSITMNDGTGTRLDSPTYQVDRIFANRDTMTLDTSRCAVGTTYTPNSGDGRKFVVYFKDETMSAYEPLPIMSLNYAPQAMYALESQKVGNFAVNNILRTVDVSGNPVTAPALDPTQLANLTNLLAGTSSLYATTTQFNSVQTFAKTAPPTCATGEVLKSNGSALSCVAVTATSSPPSSGAAAANTIDNANYAQVWNWSTATTQSPMSMSANTLTTGSLFSMTTSSNSVNSTNGIFRVANTSTSTNGILARFQSSSATGSGMTILANGNVGIGNANPNVKLVVDGGQIANISDDWSGSEITSYHASAFPYLNFTRGRGSRSTTLSMPQNTDKLGAIYFKNISTASAGIEVTATQNHSSTVSGTSMSFYTTANGSNGFSGPQMIIDHSGKVGIGVASPTAQLEVAGGVTKLEQEAWQAPTLGNSWVNYGGSYAPVGYYKDSMGVVHLRGLIKDGDVTPGTVVFTLPAGYRPSYQSVFTIVAGGGVSGRIDVDSAGKVIFQEGQNGFVSLDGITFRVQ